MNTWRENSRKSTFKELVKGVVIFQGSFTILCMEVSDHLEVWVLHGVFGTNSLSMVISEHLREQVKSLITDE